MRLAIDPLVVIVRNRAREVFAAVTEHHYEHDEGGDRGAEDSEVLLEVEEAGVGTARIERVRIAAADAKRLELGLAHRGRGQGEDEEDLSGDLAEQVKGAGVRGRWRESARCEQLGSGALRAAVGRTRTITYPLALPPAFAVSCPMPAFLQPKKKTPIMIKAIQNVPASAAGPGGSESAVQSAVFLESSLAPPREVLRARGRGGGHGGGGGGGLARGRRVVRAMRAQTVAQAYHKAPGLVQEQALASASRRPSTSASNEPTTCDCVARRAGLANTRAMETTDRAIRLVWLVEDLQCD
jgi:hypothetical protein